MRDVVSSKRPGMMTGSCWLQWYVFFLTSHPQAVLETVGLTRAGLCHRHDHRGDSRLRSIWVEDTHLGSKPPRSRARAQGIDCCTDIIPLCLGPSQGVHLGIIPTFRSARLVVSSNNHDHDTTCGTLDSDFFDCLVDAVQVSLVPPGLG